MFPWFYIGFRALVIGIDLAKHTHVARARFYDGSYSRPMKVPNTRAGFLALTEQSGWFNALRQTMDVLFPEFETVRTPNRESESEPSNP